MSGVYRWVLMTVVLVLMSPTALRAADHEKKTVCSITLNSDDEIETFQKYLPAKDFKFTELVSRDRDWLQKACRSGVQCDVIIMSGHFGGSFFGTNGFLALEEMEAASCDSRCDGIFHNPTEVYMYGCNTLAGKNKDRRTPQEYIAVLRDDGYSLSAAQQIAAFLYSPFGAAFYSRMSKVFSRVPRIYGFDGKAPLGFAIRPLLSSYVKAVAPQFYKAINDATTDKNTLYSKALSKTNATQIAGDFTDTEYPACYINNNSHSTTEKIEWIRDHILEELQSGKFDTIPMAQHFFRTLRKNNYQFSSEEESLMDQLRSNEELQTAIMGLKVKLAMMPSVAYQLSDFEHWMQWISDEDFHALEIKTFLGEDRGTYSSGLRDFVCSLDRDIDVRLEQIPAGFLHQSDFMWALACVNPTDERLVLKLSEYAIHGNQSGTLIEIAGFLAKSKTQNPEIHWNLYRAYQAHSNSTTKWFMIHALRSLPATDPEILDKLADDLLKVRSTGLVIVLSDAIAKGHAQSPQTQLKVLKAFLLTLGHPEEYQQGQTSAEHLQNSLSYVINQLRPTDSEVRMEIKRILSFYALNETQRSNLKLAIGLY